MILYFNKLITVGIICLIIRMMGRLLFGLNLIFQLGFSLTPLS
jgi:hypothetical protein